MSVDIKNCSVVAGWEFWGEIEMASGGNRYANLTKPTFTRLQTSFFAKSTAVVETIMSLYFPRSALFVPFRWGILAEVIMFFSSLYMIDTFFFPEKGSLKIQVTVQTPGFAFCHAWACGSAHSSCCTLATARTSAECPSWPSVKDIPTRENCVPFLRGLNCLSQTSEMLGVARFLSLFFVILSQPRFGTRRRMLSKTSAMLVPKICSFCTF